MGEKPMREKPIREKPMREKATALAKPETETPARCIYVFL
jgi:hypothetical protein